MLRFNLLSIALGRSVGRFPRLGSKYIIPYMITSHFGITANYGTADMFGFYSITD